MLQNHPSTISTNVAGKQFNENDLLRDMFMADNSSAVRKEDYAVNILGRHNQQAEECKSAQSGGPPGDHGLVKSGSH